MLQSLVVALLALLVANVPAGASPASRARRACRQLCQQHKHLCMASDRRGHSRLYRLCWKNLLQSCRLSTTHTFPPQPTCTFPCLSDADCGFGRKCVDLQCIIPPLFSGGSQCPTPGRTVPCGAGCCATGQTCNTVSSALCCFADYPVSCPNTCCPAGDTCRSDDRCCPPGYPVDCPGANVCCPSGTRCGPNETCVPDGGGGGDDCSCRCQDDSVCTSHADCGVDAYGIPNVCGCPVGPPCDGLGNGG